MKFSKDSFTNDFIGRQLVQVCEFLHEQNLINSSFLFGSCARGTATSTSDIDVAILTTDEITAMRIPTVSWHFYDPDVLNQPVFPIHNILIKEGIPFSKIYKELCYES